MHSTGTIHSLNEEEAFDAMVSFVEAFWIRSNKPDDMLGYFVEGVCRLNDNRTSDPAHWSDWLEAINIVKARGDNRSDIASISERLTEADGFLDRLRSTLAHDRSKQNKLSWADEELVFQLIQIARSRGEDVR